MFKTANNDDDIGRTEVFEGFSSFKRSEVKPRSGRPSTASQTKKLQITLKDRRRTIEKVVKLSGVTWSSVQNQRKIWGREE